MIYILLVGHCCLYCKDKQPRHKDKLISLPLVVGSAPPRSDGERADPGVELSLPPTSTLDVNQQLNLMS